MLPWETQTLPLSLEEALQNAKRWWKSKAKELHDPILCWLFSSRSEKKAYAGSRLSQVKHTMKLMSLVAAGWLNLCDIPMSLLKGTGANTTWGALKTAARHDILPTNHVSVGSLPTAIRSGRCDHTCPPDISSKGSQNLSFYLGENRIMLALYIK